MALPLLEIHYKLYQSDLKSKDDAIVCLFHLLCVVNKLKCIGNADEITATDYSYASASELLPSDWNSKDDVYILNYIDSDNNIYIIKIIKAGTILLFNGLHHQSQRSATVDIVTDEFVSDDFMDFKSAYANIDELCLLLKEEFLLKLFKDSNTPKATTSKPSAQSQDKKHEEKRKEENPLLEERFRGGQPSRLIDFEDELGVYGRGDLDPLGGGRGGMLFNPSRDPPPFGPIMNPRPSLPRGLPPGARYDPIFPGQPGRNPRFPQNPGPDPDHLPPPGYDDMFG